MSFLLNVGQFSLKEHVLITIFATSRSTGVYAINIVTTGKGFYHRTIHPAAAYLLALSTQSLGMDGLGFLEDSLLTPLICAGVSIQGIS